MTNYLYDDNINKYQKLQQQSYLKDCALKVEEVDKGIVANVDEALLHYPYGVIRQDGTFVSISGMYLYQLPYELQCTGRTGVSNFYDRIIIYNGLLGCGSMPTSGILLFPS